MLTVFYADTRIVSVHTVQRERLEVTVYIPKDRRTFLSEKKEQEFHAELRREIDQSGDILYQQSDNLQ
jgi:hypothetical protein